MHGARLWIVRDSAVVHYEEHLLVEERTLDTLASIDRSGDGTIVGRHLLDPALGLDLVRDDTTALQGFAILGYPDGRTFRTPARFERTQRVELLDEATYQARQRRRREEQGEFSIVIRPEGDAERVASGDTAYTRALLDTLDNSRDPAALARAAGLLEMYGRGAIGPRVQASLLRVGDTASVIRRLENEWMETPPFSESDFNLLLPFLADPGLAFSFGLERDPHYENARQALLTHPPALTRDTAGWPCAPATCRALAAQRDVPGDPRLRSLALIARLTLDPRRWADTVRARFAHGDRFLEPAVTLLDGVAATWPAGSHSPLPAPGASWRAWSNWMDGRNPGYTGPREPVLARFEDAHAQAIRIAEALGGRDFVGEWRDALRTAASDSAQYVYGSMLLGMGVAFDDADAIAARLRSPSKLVRALATEEVSALLDSNPRLADSATTEEVQGRVLAVALDSAPAWPELDPTPRRVRGKSAMPRNLVKAADWAYERPAPTPGPLVLVGDDLAPAVRALWAARKVRITDSHWQPKSSESVIIVSVSDVSQVGSFARVTIDHSHLTARINGRGQSWAAGTTLYLMRRGGQWFIVSASAWIT